MISTIRLSLAALIVVVSSGFQFDPIKPGKSDLVALDWRTTGTKV